MAAANVDQAKGNFESERQILHDRRQRPDSGERRIRRIIVAYRNGAPVRLTDVADVVDDVENIKQAAWMNTTPAVIVNIQRQPGANIIEVVDRIKALLPQLKASLPASVEVAILTDRTTTIRASVGDVQFELMLTDRSRRDGDVPLPAQSVGDRHSQRRGAAVSRRHVRRDVPDGLQPEQPDADGVDDLDRFRRGRRDRHDREHHALHRRRRIAAAGRAEGVRADRVHDCVADGFADRRADPAAVHGRHRRAGCSANSR